MVTSWRREAADSLGGTGQIFTLSTLGEVLWSFAEEGLRQARAAATGSDPDRIVDVFQRFIRLNAIFRPLRRFIEQDPELGLRVLTSKSSPSRRA